MRVRRLVGICVSVSFLLAAVLSPVAYAGFVELKGSPSDSTHQWVIDLSGKVNLQESVSVIGYDNVFVTGQTNEDPLIEWEYIATNDTDATWKGYELTLEGATFDYTEPGLPWSDYFHNNNVKEDYRLTFDSPDTVPPEVTVTMDFDIMVPETGGQPFSITLTGRAIPIPAVPEPATICLLALGGLALRRKRKS